MCFAVCGRDYTLEVLIMIVGGHVIEMSVYGIGKAVVAHIYHDKEILPSHRRAEAPLCLTGPKTRAVALYQIIIALVGRKEGRI